MIPEGLAHLGRLRLASRSPQRRAILTMLGIEFDVVEPDYDEPDLPGAPAQIAVAHARAKAASVQGERVLGVDTIVVIDVEFADAFASIAGSFNGVELTVTP